MRARRPHEDRRVNPPELVRALDALRVRKTPYEWPGVAEANRRAAPGHEECGGCSGRRSDELELHLAFLGTTRQDAETPYKNIVALASTRATLHHVSYQTRAAGAIAAGRCGRVLRGILLGITGHG